MNITTDSTKLDEKFAAEQVTRLSVLAHFPSDPLLRAEVMKALRLWCVGRRIDQRGAVAFANEQCQQVIDDAILTLKGWRAPSQLKEIYDDLFPPRPRWGKDGPLE
jgi:hypothetical protein